MALDCSALFAIFLVLYIGITTLRSEIIICNNNTFPCAHSSTQPLKCAENALCKIICESKSICESKQLICKHNQNCEIHCNSEESCKSANILCGNSLCNIYAKSSNALQYATVTAINNTELNIHCMVTNACTNAHINGKLSSNTNIISNASNASNLFKDITITCPTKLNDIYQTKRCHLVNNVTHMIDQHDVLTIHAQNSFNDIDISNYNGIATGNMFCSGGQCAIPYGLWNCKDASNPCYVHNEGIETQICDAANKCQNMIVNCNGTNIEECNIICSGLYSCSNTTINCNNAAHCNVVCSGQLSCNGISDRYSTVINCGLSDCRIICGTDSNAGSCYRSIINGTGPTLQIYALGIHSLSQSKIYCGNEKECHIFCNEDSACEQIKVYASNGSDTELRCKYPCVNAHIFCKDCVLYGEGTLTNLELYCVNSWNDIEMNMSNHIINDGMMHCTETFDKSCVIYNNTKCLCPPITTIMPTVTPTLPLNQTMPDVCHGIKCLDAIEVGLVATFMIAFVLILVGWGYWYCACKTDDDLYTQTIEDEESYDTQKQNSHISALSTIDETQRLNAEITDKT